MKRIIYILVTCFVYTASYAGDREQSPNLNAGSGYVSLKPQYHLVGVENTENETRLWVVAKPVQVFNQTSVNNIIIGIRSHLNNELSKAIRWEVLFYSAYHEAEAPSFLLNEFLGYYNSKDNKTIYMKHANSSGGWAHGPAFQ